MSGCSEGSLAPAPSCVSQLASGDAVNPQAVPCGITSAALPQSRSFANSSAGVAALSMQSRGSSRVGTPGAQRSASASSVTKRAKSCTRGSPAFAATIAARTGNENCAPSAATRARAAAIGRAGIASSARSRRITLRWPQCSAGVSPTCVHSQPR